MAANSRYTSRFWKCARNCRQAGLAPIKKHFGRICGHIGGDHDAVHTQALRQQPGGQVFVNHDFHADQAMPVRAVHHRNAAHPGCNDLRTAAHPAVNRLEVEHLQRARRRQQPAEVLAVRGYVSAFFL